MWGGLWPEAAAVTRQPLPLPHTGKAQIARCWRWELWAGLTGLSEVSSQLTCPYPCRLVCLPRGGTFMATDESDSLEHWSLTHVP